MSDRKINFSVRSEIYDVFLDVKGVFFETQKEQKKQKCFHKRLLYVLRFTDMLQKIKNFCENPFVSFVPFVFQKKRLLRLGTRHKSHF